MDADRRLEAYAAYRSVVEGADFCVVEGSDGGESQGESRGETPAAWRSFIEGAGRMDRSERRFFATVTERDPYSRKTAYVAAWGSTPVEAREILAQYLASDDGLGLSWQEAELFAAAAGRVS